MVVKELFLEQKKKWQIVSVYIFFFNSFSQLKVKFIYWPFIFSFVALLKFYLGSVGFSDNLNCFENKDYLKQNHIMTDSTEARECDRDINRNWWLY